MPHVLNGATNDIPVQNPVPPIRHLPRRASWHCVGWLLDGHWILNCKALFEVTVALRYLNVTPLRYGVVDYFFGLPRSGQCQKDMHAWLLACSQNAITFDWEVNRYCVCV